MDQNSVTTKLPSLDLVVIDCEVYSRVCGYYRPVSGFNPGKKQEFEERETLKIRNDINNNR